MSRFELGNRLIFLISQPRAGSTLVQRILASHPKIHTLSEPWLMLHGVYGLRNEGYWAEYDARLAFQGTRKFLKSIPNGEGSYIESLRMMYEYLYERSLTGRAEEFFLDKTPRYYFIIPELFNIFPNARFIILLRNPLAVACSIFRTWGKPAVGGLRKHRSDLILAPQLLRDGMCLLNEKAYVLRYEELLHAPDNKLDELCRYLGVDFRREMMSFDEEQTPRWSMGDQGKIYTEGGVDEMNADAWQRYAGDPQIYRILHDYMNLVPNEVWSGLGYPSDKNYHVLGANKPKRLRLIGTKSLKCLLN